MHYICLFQAKLRINNSFHSCKQINHCLYLQMHSSTPPTRCTVRILYSSLLAYVILVPH